MRRIPLLLMSLGLVYLFGGQVLAAPLRLLTELEDACLTEASNVATAHGADLASFQFVTPRLTVFVPLQCASGACEKESLFSAEKKLLEDLLKRQPGPVPGPKPLGKRGKCTALWFLEANPSKDAAQKPKPSLDGQQPDDGRVDKEKLQDLTDPMAVYNAYTQGRRTKSGFSQGAAADAAAEAIQILGQIVVDRASAAAYRLIQDKLQTWLCKVEGGEPKDRLPEVCTVLRSLRIQDLAAAPNRLIIALLSDVSVLLLAQFSSELPGVEIMVKRILLPALANSEGKLEARSAELMVRELIAHWVTKEEVGRLCPTKRSAPGAEPTELEGSKAIALAGLAFMKCSVTAEYGIGDCPIVDHVEQLAGKCAAGSDTRSEARRIASFIQGAFSGKDQRQRLVHGAKAVFAALRLAAEPKSSAEKYLPSLERAFDAALDRDTNGLLLAAATTSELACAGAEECPDRLARGIRLLGPLAQYVETYSKAQGDSKDQHDRRTKLLESVTRDMTDRSGRKGDSIFSLGGSLRAVAGGRIGLGGVSGRGSFYGPLSLALGIGYQYVPTTSPVGFHMELGALDLGQYLSFEEGGQVKTPDLQDALAPSFSIGLYWGVEFPVILAASIGYSPRFEFGAKEETTATATTPPDQTRGHALTLGLNLGIYVPLLDIN